MPELPEVETIRRALDPELIGRSITDAWAFDSAKFTPAVDASGSTFTGTERRGKYLILNLSDDRDLVIHLGMTGVLRLDEATGVDEMLAHDPYVRAMWELDGREALVFRDVRRFGRLRVVPHHDYSTITTLHALGPEPLSPDFTADGLFTALRRSSRRVKTQLLSQLPVAGVGNIYADEALWRSQIYPAKRRVTRAEAERLHEAIVDVLQAGVDNGGTTLRDYRTFDGGEGQNQHHLDCYGQGGRPCTRCTTTLVSRVWDARTTTFCPRCQPR